MSRIFSTHEELESIATILVSCLRLPVATNIIPGSLLESVMAHVRGGRVLPTYDYIDVIQDDQKVGWSIKSTRAATPLTWKRAKIEGKDRLMADSSPDGLQCLGDKIIDFCNEHARKCFQTYPYLNEIGYARLIIKPKAKSRKKAAKGESGDDGFDSEEEKIIGQQSSIIYFERLLCDRGNPNIFEPADFRWEWSSQKSRKEGSKEQLTALHGFDRIHPVKAAGAFGCVIMADNGS